jgi:hypothetical protein
MVTQVYGLSLAALPLPEPMTGKVAEWWSSDSVSA